MIKSILALFILLFLLIFTCVYQKTYTLYEKYNKTSSNPSAVLIDTSLSTLEKEIVEPKIQVHDEITPEPIKTANIPLLTSTHPSELSIIEKKPADLEPVSEDINTSVHEQKVLSTSHRNQDIKEIDNLLQALKNRDIALKYRDELTVRIEQLIRQALENRTFAIDHMNKEELHLLDLQKELLRTRDIAYNKIGQTNTLPSGE